MPAGLVLVLLLLAGETGGSQVLDGGPRHLVCSQDGAAPSGLLPSLVPSSCGPLSWNGDEDEEGGPLLVAEREGEDETGQGAGAVNGENGAVGDTPEPALVSESIIVEEVVVEGKGLDDSGGGDDDDEEDEEEGGGESQGAGSGDGGDDGDDDEEDEEDDEEDEDDDDEEDEDEDEDEEDEEDAAEQAHNRTSSSNATRSSAAPSWKSKGRGVLPEAVVQAVRKMNASAAVLTPYLPLARNVTTAVVKKHGVKLVVAAVLLVVLHKHLTMQNITQLSMLLGIVIEIMSRLGLFRRGGLPLSALRDGSLARSPPTFSFEFLNDRFTADFIDLQLQLARQNPANVLLPPPKPVQGPTVPPPGTAFQAYGRTAPPAPTPAPAAAAPSPANQTVAENGTAVPVTTANATAVNATGQQQQPQQLTRRPRCYVSRVKGDMMFSQGPFLTQLVSFLLATMQPSDELVLLLESGGGVVQEYGLAASQLERLRRVGYPLTVCVDKVAASGGYMLACVATRVVAAPFAFVGSIGAMTSQPLLNVGELLKRWGIQAYPLKSGKHKGGGMLLMGDAEEAREAVSKAQQDLRKVHESFKAHVAKYRKAVDIELVATGEVWQGQEARSLGLVDEVMTAEELLSAKVRTHQVIVIKPYEGKKLLGGLWGPRRRGLLPLEGRMAEGWVRPALQSLGQWCRGMPTYLASCKGPW